MYHITIAMASHTWVVPSKITDTDILLFSSLRINGIRSRRCVGCLLNCMHYLEINHENCQSLLETMNVGGSKFLKLRLF